MKTRVLNIRKVPDDLYLLAKIQAATRGMTLQEFVIAALKAAMPKGEKVKNGFIGITRVLALSGMTDFSFVEENDLWRGSEVHKCVSLAAKGTLVRTSVPEELRGYLAARDKFVRETGYITLKTEENVQDKKLKLRGRIDDHGLLHGKPAMCEYKSGAIQVAVKYQLCLGGHMLQPGEWFHRFAVQLKADGTYKMKHWPLISWPHDLATGLACVRVARAKIADGISE